MKKILLIGLAVCFYSNIALAEGCAKGGGRIVTAVNGTKYCLSKVIMNWWSAFAWCDTSGYKMPHPNTDCDCEGYPECDPESSCGNLKGIGENWQVTWTSLSDGQKGGTISLGEGSLSKIDKKAPANTYILCRM